MPNWLVAPHPLLIFAIGFITGFFLSRVAAKKGKNPRFWFMIGFFMGLSGFLIFGIVLLLDKRNIRTQVQLKKILFSEALWYYLDSEKMTIGPMSHQKLSELFQGGTIKQDTFVWNEELKDWKKVEEMLC